MLLETQDRMPIKFKKAKISQAELAKRVGSNKGYISRVENGQTEPKISTLIFL
jgi:transcriptional regulator with XRE-family HTH domain